jgi:catalase
LRAAAKVESANVEIIAPVIAGATLDDGTLLPADQMVGGGPSVLYDAVAVVVSDAGAAELAQLPPAKDFVSDAHAHCKLIAYTPEAMPLFDAAGVAEAMDAGYHPITARASALKFIAACRELRWWDRA